MFSLSQKLSQIPSWVRFVGRNSLVIYMLQVCGFVPVRMVTKLLKLDEILSRPFLALIHTIVVVAICSILSVIINKYIPIATGNRK